MFFQIFHELIGNLIRNLILWLNITKKVLNLKNKYSYVKVTGRVSVRVKMYVVSR